MTVQNVNEAIAKLESLDPLDNQAYEKALLAYANIKQLPFLIYEFEDQLTFFRTRTHDDDTFFTNIADISIPPSSAVKSFARCNRPFQPVFYCSENRPTSYMELLEYWAKDKVGNSHLFVTLSQWTLNKNFKTLIVSSPHSQDRVTRYDLEQGQALDEFINQYTGEFKDAMILFYKFLFDKFRKPAKNDLRTYIITSAYCNLAFSKTNEIDAIFYPSVPFQGSGVNFAITPNYDLSNLELDLVVRNKFEIDNSNPLPSFTEVELIKAKSIDKTQNLIVWH